MYYIFSNTFEMDNTEDYTSEEEEEVELCEQDLFTQPRLKKKNTYDVESWDYRVAVEITRIHREAFRKSENTKFSNWVNTHLDHLQNIYRLSGSQVPEETFYTFIYDHLC